MVSKIQKYLPHRFFSAHIKKGLFFFSSFVLIVFFDDKNNCHPPPQLPNDLDLIIRSKLNRKLTTEKDCMLVPLQAEGLEAAS